MAGTSYLSLSREHHSTEMILSLHALLEANNLVDCILSSDGQFLKAHKVILSACSPYFELLFKEEADKYPIVLLKDIEFDYLKLIVEFVYRGDVQICESQLNTFLEVAKFLQIKGLNAPSEECTPAREEVFSEIPGKTNVTEAVKEITIEDDDDCKVIEEAVGNGQHCIDGDDRMIITDESTFSLAPQVNPVPGTHALTNDADHAWYMRPSSPVSVTSITSVKTEQLVDYEETGLHSRAISESENENEVHQANGDQRPASSEEMEPVKVTTRVEKRNSAGKRAYAPKSRSVGKTNTKPPPARKQMADSSSSSEATNDASDAESTQNRDGNQEPADESKAGKYLCAVCNRSFLYKCWLRKHLRHHTGERPFKCTECGKDFAFRQNLKSHMVSHARKRPFTCSTCAMCFPSLSALKSHLKVHSGDKPYKCSLCKYATKHSSDLARHRRSHSGERPFKCEQCDYAAVCSSHLRNHLRAHERQRKRGEATAVAAAVATSERITTAIQTAMAASAATPAADELNAHAPSTSS